MGNGDSVERRRETTKDRTYTTTHTHMNVTKKHPHPQGDLPLLDPGTAVAYLQLAVPNLRLSKLLGQCSALATDRSTYRPTDACTDCI